MSDFIILEGRGAIMSRFKGTKSQVKSYCKKHYNALVFGYKIIRDDNKVIRWL